MVFKHSIAVQLQLFEDHHFISVPFFRHDLILQLCTLLSKSPTLATMDQPRLQAAILIISDTAFQDPSTDKAGDILSDVIVIDGNDQWESTKRDIVPDDVPAIQRAVSQYCDGEDYVNLLITTGGTGFAVKDNTPEAVAPLIHRHAPGLV